MFRLLLYKYRKKNDSVYNTLRKFLIYFCHFLITNLFIKGFVLINDLIANIRHKDVK